MCVFTANWNVAFFFSFLTKEEICSNVKGLQHVLLDILFTIETQTADDNKNKQKNDKDEDDINK